MPHAEQNKLVNHCPIKTLEICEHFCVLNCDINSVVYDSFPTGFDHHPLNAPLKYLLVEYVHLSSINPFPDSLYIYILYI